MGDRTQELIKILDQYPCCVCTLEECVGLKCPAANGGEGEYLLRIKELVDEEIPLIKRAAQIFPPELEEIIDIREYVETSG